MLKFILLVIIALLPAFRAENMCGKSDTCVDNYSSFHVDCYNYDADIKWCISANLTEVNIQPIRTEIVKKLNTVRNRVAGGTLPSTRMGTLRWNAELAQQARKLVNLCITYKSYCLNTPTLKYVGYSGDFTYYKKKLMRNDLDVVLETVDRWNTYQSKTSQNDIRSFPPYTGRDHFFRTFSQMVRGFATRVGCAALRFDEEDSDQEDQHCIMLVCAYDSDTTVSYPVYGIGPTASKCKTGKNPNFPNLCSLNESFNVNEFWNEY